MIRPAASVTMIPSGAASTTAETAASVRPTADTRAVPQYHGLFVTHAFGTVHACQAAFPLVGTLLSDGNAGQQRSPIRDRDLFL